MSFTAVARRAGLLAVVAALAAAGGARAQTTPPPTAPDERAAAREFSFAAYRLRVAVLAQRDAIDAKLLGVTLDAFLDPRCDRAVDAAPEDRAIEVLLVSLLLALAPAYDPIRPALDRFLAELERVPTADPVLRSGRAGWRSEIDVVRRLPSVPDPCGAVQAWRRANFAASVAPIPIEAVIAPGVIAAEGKLALAARRMRALGVSEGAARRFTPKGLFAGVDIDVF